MKYRKMGNSDIEVSVVGHGTWALGNDFFGEVDTEKGIRAIHQAMDLGVNLIDTAPAYGSNYDAEIAVGKALEGRRDKAIISTKVGTFRYYGDYVNCLSPEIVTAELEHSLKRLKTDYIDIYMIHWPDYNAGIDRALDLLAKFKKEGKIRAAAVSNFSLAQIKVAQEKADICCLQPPCSLFDHSYFDNGIIPYCNENNIGIMTYGSLGGGILTGRITKPIVNGGKEQRNGFYNFFNEPMWSNCNKVLDVLKEIASNRGVAVSEVAINWVLAQPGITTTLCGSTNPDNVKENVHAAEWDITSEELAKIDEAYAKYMK